MSDLLPDGRNRLEQENSLLKSQFENCHKEIRRLREELLRYSTPADAPICATCGRPAVGVCDGSPISSRKLGGGNG